MLQTTAPWYTMMVPTLTVTGLVTHVITVQTMPMLTKQTRIRMVSVTHVTLWLAHTRTGECDCHHVFLTCLRYRSALQVTAAVWCLSVFTMVLPINEPRICETSEPSGLIVVSETLESVGCLS